MPLILFYKKYWRTAMDIAFIALTIYLLMVSFRFVYEIAAPILLAFVLFWITEPFSQFLHRRKIKKTIAAALSMATFLFLLFSLLVGAGAMVTVQMIGLQKTIDNNAIVIQRQVFSLFEYAQKKIEALPPDTSTQLDNAVRTMTTYATKVVRTVLGSIVTVITSLSTFVINFIIAVILAYFLSIEIPYWRKFAQQNTPRTFRHAYDFLRDHVIKGIASYIRTQFLLLSCTFFVILITLLFLRVDNALSIAMLAAFFDLLPLLGVSTIFVPWILYCFFSGNIALGVGLTVLLLVVLLFRQVMEPRLTAQSIGVSAFTVLAGMIVSLSLFGIAGLILAPVLIILLKALSDEGYLRRWIRLPAEEFAGFPAPEEPRDNTI